MMLINNLKKTVMKKRVFFFIVCMVATYSNINAQTIELKTEYMSQSSYRIMKSESSEQVGNSKGSAMVHQANITIPLFKKMNENNRPVSWAVNVSGTYAKLNNKNFTRPLVIDEILNVGLSLNHLRPLNEKWSMMATVGVGIYMPGTDLSQIGFKNVLGNIGAVFIRHLKPNLDLGGGLVLSNSFGYPMVYPAFYLNWRTGGKFDVKIAIMDGLEISTGYDVNKKLRLNLLLEMNGQMALLEQDGKDMIFSHMNMVAGFRPEIKISQHLSIPITVGISLWRPTEMKERKLSSIFKGGKDYFFGTSFYMSAALKIGF